MIDWLEDGATHAPSPGKRESVLSSRASWVGSEEIAPAGHQRAMTAHVPRVNRSSSAAGSCGSERTRCAACARSSAWMAGVISAIQPRVG